MSLIFHNIQPVYNENSKVLILGTIPSPKSREANFFYGHPQNNFWKVTAQILNCQVPLTIEDKKEMLLKNNIALWDVLHSCEISGASDSSIKNPVVNDFSEILSKSKIKAVFTTGATATKLYNKYCFDKTKIATVYLPSTSPANKRYYNFDTLIEKYKILLNFLK